MTNRNTLKKAKLVQDIVASHYEPGRQDRCKLAVFRNVVVKTYPMSERTFFRMLGLQMTTEPTKDRFKQLTLF